MIIQNRLETQDELCLRHDHRCASVVLDPMIWPRPWKTFIRTALGEARFIAKIHCFQKTGKKSYRASARRASKALVEYIERASLAKSGRMPLVAYVSRKTCVASTPTQSASSAVPARHEKREERGMLDSLVKRLVMSGGKNYLTALPVGGY